MLGIRAGGPVVQTKRDISSIRNSSDRQHKLQHQLQCCHGAFDVNLGSPLFNKHTQLRFQVTARDACDKSKRVDFT